MQNHFQANFRALSFNLLTSLVTSLTLFFSVSTFARETIGFGYREDLTQPGLTVVVRDESTGSLIPDADIQISGDDLKIASVKRAGYAQIIVAGLKRGELIVYLKPTGSFGSQVVLNGEVENYLPLLNGNVDGALILRTLGVSDLLSLNPATLMSPLKDTIQVLGAREIPSNLVFPTQTIGIILKLSKPTFRLPMCSFRKSRMVAIQAAIPTGNLLSLPSSPSAPDLVNLLTARKIGWTEELSPISSGMKNISLTTNVDHKIQLEIPNPSFPADLYGLNLLDLQSDRQNLAASDVKALKKGTFQPTGMSMISLSSMSTPPAGSIQKVVAAALGENGGRISVSVLPGGTDRVKAPDFLNPEPMVKGALPNELKLTSMSQGILIVSLQEKTTADGNFGKQVFILPSMGQMTVPLKDLAADMKVARYSFSRLEFDEAFQSKAFEAGDVVKNLKRYTFSGEDLPE